MTPQPAGAAGGQIIGREEKIEYRDEHGNLLDAEQVAALEGKVSFKTRYETRTRVVDAAGNEVADEALLPEAMAAAEPGTKGTYADGQNPETVGPPQDEASQTPPTVDVEGDRAKEASIEAAGSGEARPASEGSEATK